MSNDDQKYTAEEVRAMLDAARKIRPSKDNGLTVKDGTKVGCGIFLLFFVYIPLGIFAVLVILAALGRISG